MARKVRIGIIGAGGIAQWAHIPAYQAAKDAEIVAVADLKLDLAREVAEKFSIPRVFADYKEMLQMEEIDVASVCTPNALHMPASVDALEAGKHVLCEKPMALNAQEGLKMVETARRTGRKLMIGLNHRFLGRAQALKGIIKGGALGEIYFGKAVWARRRGIPSLPGFTKKAISGGGALIDIGVHMLDLTLWFMGLPKPVSVMGATYAKIGTKKPAALVGGWDPRNFEVEDLGVGLVKFENGAALFLEAAFAVNTEKGDWNSILYGDKGGAQFDPFRIFTEYGGMLADITPVNVPEPDSFKSEVSAFLDSIRKDKPVPIPAEEALVSAVIIDAIYESAETGKEIRTTIPARA